MGKSDLFAKLPSIWKRLDTYGVLERYLGVFDFEFDRIDSLIKSLSDSRSIEKIEDFYVRLLSDLVGVVYDDSM
ncbi:MAG: hypothetical protein ACP5RW_09165, partial [bacterium]